MTRSEYQPQKIVADVVIDRRIDIVSLAAL